MQSEKIIPTNNLAHNQSFIVSELAGIVPSEIAEISDYKQEYVDYLEEKYAN